MNLPNVLAIISHVKGLVELANQLDAQGITADVNRLAGVAQNLLVAAHNDLNVITTVPADSGVLEAEITDLA